MTGFDSTGCSHDGTQRDLLYGIRPPRDSPGGRQPRRDSTGFSGSAPRCTRAAAEPAGVATKRPSGPAGPTPTDSQPAGGAATSLAASAVTSLAAGAATSLAAASLVFVLCRSGPCVCRLLRDRMSLGSLISNTQNKRVYLGFRGVVPGGEGDSHSNWVHTFSKK